MTRSKWIAAALVLTSAGLSAQIKMPNPKEISGVALPAGDVAVGTVSVRVVRGGFDKNLPDVPVEFVVSGKSRTIKTDADGRAQVTALSAGTHVQARVTVDGERLESQDVVIGASGIRIVLVATDPEATAREAENRTLAASPAEKGIVALGPETRMIVEPAEDALNVFYVLDIVNSARTPVDIGGPVIVDLPTEARGAGVMEGSSPQAKTLGTHVTIVGPFAPGTTHVEVGFGLPYSGGSVRLEQKWPLALPQVTLLMQRVGATDVHSPQLSGRREMNDQGQPILISEGPALPAGAMLALDFVGLPHRSLWPRYTALALASLLVVGGLWVALRRPLAAPQVPRATLEAERGRLLDRLAALDRDRAAERVSESTYGVEREATVARLSQIYAALDASASAA